MYSRILNFDKYNHVEVINELVKDLDPYDPDLTDEQKKMIIEECKQNIFYFLKKIVKIPYGYPSIPIDFSFNLGTLAATSVYKSKNDFISSSNVPDNFLWIRLPRMCGKTILLVSLSIYEKVFSDSYVSLTSGIPHMNNISHLNGISEYITDKLPDYILDYKRSMIKNGRKNTLYVDEAEWISYKRYRSLTDLSIYNRIYFFSVVNKNIDPELYYELYRNYDKIDITEDFNNKIDLSYEKTLIECKAEKIFTKDALDDMRRMLGEEFFKTEILLMR